jgi:hypothetical protein
VQLFLNRVPGLAVLKLPNLAYAMLADKLVNTAAAGEASQAHTTALAAAAAAGRHFCI